MLYPLSYEGGPVRVQRGAPTGPRAALVTVPGRPGRQSGATPVPITVSLWYHRRMDVNVKGLEPEVVARLAEQAAAEGVSAQEWMREALRRTAALLTPHELDELVAGRRPVSDARYQEATATLTARRAAWVSSMVDAAKPDVRKRRR